MPTDDQQQDQAGDGDGLNVAEALASWEADQPDDAASGQDAATAEDDSDQNPVAPDDDPRIALPGGEEIPLSDLTAGYLRQQDYNTRVQELNAERQDTESWRGEVLRAAEDIGRQYEALQAFAEQLLPAEPPVSLARSDPGAYQYQQALRQRALNELGGLFQAAQHTASAAQSLDAATLARYRADEARKLEGLLPQLKTPGARAAFDKANLETGTVLGFSPEEIQATADARMLHTLHYARLGMLADKHRAATLKGLPGKPKPGGQPAPGRKPPGASAEAMRRLSKSGSLRDAMGVDFE